MKSTKAQDSMLGSVHQKSAQFDTQLTMDLVAEFVKSRPDQQKVRKLMQQMNLPLSDDPIEQMSQCLRYLNDMKQTATSKLAPKTTHKKERMKEL